MAMLAIPAAAGAADLVKSVYGVLSGDSDENHSEGRHIAGV